MALSIGKSLERSNNPTERYLVLIWEGIRIVNLRLNRVSMVSKDLLVISKGNLI